MHRAGNGNTAEQERDEPYQAEETRQPVEHRTEICFHVGNGTVSDLIRIQDFVVVPQEKFYCVMILHLHVGAKTR